MFKSVCLIALSLCAVAPAADSPQWRGANRDGKPAGAAVGLNGKDGELLWRYPKVATPIVDQDRVFVSTHYGTGCALSR
jgi:hypothetical protein